MKSRKSLAELMKICLSQMIHECEQKKNYMTKCYFNITRITSEGKQKNDG